MKEITDNTEAIKPADYLVAALLDFYRHPKNAHNFLHAAKLAQTIMTRNAAHKATALEKRFLFLARKLKDDITILSLREFSEKCFSAAIKVGACAQASSPKQFSLKTLKKYAKEDVSTSLRQGHSEGASINRAAYELVRKQKEEMAKLRLNNSIRTHPLRETLEGLMVKESRLAKEDIRNQFLRLRRPSPYRNNGEGMLYGLLAKAQAFAAVRLHRLLGDELFFLCRPSGFLDQKATIVVVEVPSSAHLHALTYRKLEILRALKEDSAFLLVNKLHFVVKS